MNEPKVVRKYKKFSKEVTDKLGYYVYRLVDPRNGETFYIGKGHRNRIFDHVSGILKTTKTEDEFDRKMKRIHEIHNSGFDVLHLIHRHAMSEKTALEVEAALIDSYSGTTNAVGGHGSAERGVMHADQVQELYSAEVAKIPKHSLIIKIGKSLELKDPYEAARYAWRIDVERARRAPHIFAVSGGLIVGAFVATRWLKATPRNFPGTSVSIPGRWGFVGEHAPENFKNQFLRKRIHDKYMRKGAASPIRYAY